MKRFYLLFIFGSIIFDVTAQNWLTFSVPQFDPALIEASRTEMVNMYEVKGKPKESDGNTRVVRVVKYPSMSYTFDRAGNKVEEIQYKEGTETVAMHTALDYQKGLLVEKQVRTFVYNDSKTDTLVAQHRIQRYRYDWLERLSGYEIHEVNQDAQVQTQNAILTYGSDKEIQSVHFQFYDRDLEAHTDYTHLENHWSIGLRKDGGKIRVQRDELGRFTQIIDYLPNDDAPSAQVSYFYKGEKLDSTHALYWSPGRDRAEAREVNARYYYDQQGRLVMIRTKAGNGILREQLFEYFPFSEGE